jgi:cytosine/adenosine deaminase-related metal-dependent hydrolase
MFSVARFALGTQRALDNAHSKDTQQKLPDTSTIYCKQALEWITIKGAQALNLDDKIGSLTVGKQADLVLINADDLNMSPVHDPISSVVMQTSLANIDTVIIAGQTRKEHGRLIYPNLGELKTQLSHSGMRLMKALQHPAH